MALKIGLPVHARWMVRHDMADVLRIEHDSFGAGAWGEDDFLRVLRQRNVVGMVAVHRERVVGYLVYQLERHEVVVLNLGVDPACRRQHVGTQLANKLKTKLTSARTRLTLTVRETNLSAQKFWAAQECRAVGVARGFYDDEDGFTFAYQPTTDEFDPCPSPSRIAPYLKD